MAIMIGAHRLGHQVVRPTWINSSTPVYSVPLFPGPVSKEYVDLFHRCGWRIRYSRRSHR